MSTRNMENSRRKLLKDQFNAGKNALRFSGNKSTVEAGSYKGVTAGGERTVSLWVLGESGESGGLLY